MDRRTMSAIALCAVGVIFVAAQSASGAPPNKDVRVVNTTEDPVPTVAQGVTTVAGTIEATQSGPWSVAVEGTPPVHVANEEPIPVSVQGTGAEPFQMSANEPIPGGASQITKFIDIPEGKILVVEYISFLGGDVDTDVAEELAYGAVFQATSGETGTATVPGTTTGEFGAAGGPVNLRISDRMGVQVRVQPEASGTRDDAYRVIWTVNGHLIDA